MSEWLCFTDRLQTPPLPLSVHKTSSHFAAANDTDVVRTLSLHNVANKVNTHGFIPEIRESIDEGEIFLGWCENMDLIESVGNGVNMSGYGVRGRRRK